MIAFWCMPLQDSVEVINAGIGGNTTEDLRMRIQTDVLEKKPDLVLIMAGTNDMVNSGKLIDTMQYRENISVMLELLKSRDIQAVLMSPPPVDTGYLYMRHDPKVFKGDLPNERLHQARDILQQTAQRYEVPFIDLYSAFLLRRIPWHNRDGIIMNEMNSGKPDGVHPTPQGYAWMAGLILNGLQENGLIRNGMRIICFGDSITRGSFVEGAGTVYGSTYPAVLRKLIEKSLH